MIKEDFKNLESMMTLDEGLSCEDILRKLTKAKINYELNESENKLLGANKYFKSSTICIDAASSSINCIEKEVEKTIGKSQDCHARGKGSIISYYGKYKLIGINKLPNKIKEVLVDNEFRLIELTRIYCYNYEM